MRRGLTRTALILLILAGVTGQGHQVGAATRQGVVYAESVENANGDLTSVGPGDDISATDVTPNDGEWRWRECRFRSYSGSPLAWNRAEILLVIRCGVRLWPVFGGAAQAVRVATCESGLGPNAHNPNGHWGLYQFSPSTFASVRAHWRDLWRRMGVPNVILDVRANALGAIRKASADGWGAWAGCA